MRGRSEHENRCEREKRENRDREGFTIVDPEAAKPNKNAANWTTDDELDLTFYLVAADSKCGMRSNLATQLEALRLGRRRVDGQHDDPDGPMVDSIDDARRARRVHQILAKLTAEERRVLAAAFGWDPLPGPMLVRFGNGIAGVVLAMFKDQMPRVPTQDEILALRARAERALYSSCSAYARAKTP